MGEIVNLRREKKRRARVVSAQAAAENRVRFGREGAQRQNDVRALDRDRARVENAALDPTDGKRTGG